MKKVLLVLTSIIVSFFMITNVKAEGLVKVYIFEAGGCPACEAQLEYLNNLESKGTKFEIIQKELYVDHVDWERGKDYDLGVKVVNYFNAHGFADAGYTSTPLVVVSDVYAKNGYNASLESYINKAYNAGDKDIVGLIERDELVEESYTVVIIAIGVILVAGVALLVFVASKDSKKKN